jgi:hypothetical protein
MELLTQHRLTCINYRVIIFVLLKTQRQWRIHHNLVFSYKKIRNFNLERESLQGFHIRKLFGNERSLRLPRLDFDSLGHSFPSK